MRLTLANEYVRIYDDFLPRESFEPLLEYANSETYELIHRDTWHVAWRLGDGLPLSGTPTFYRDDAALYQSRETPRYPTETPLDAFIEGFNNVVDDAAELVGKRGTWNGVSFSPFLHPAGTGLSLHRDRHAYTGSYTYYIHRQWNFHWGGHLLVLDPRTAFETDPKPLPFLSDDDENQVVSEHGIALCVLAKPNRLVLLAPEVYHMVTQVDANAGDRTRVTIAGFFLKR